MSDCIDRQAAIDVHCELCPDQHICCPVRNGNICKDIDEFKMIPSAQRKTGKWIKVSSSFAYCNQCGEPAPYWAMSSNYHLSNYCPSCGARMDGEIDG